VGDAAAADPDGDLRARLQSRQNILRFELVLDDSGKIERRRHGKFLSHRKHAREGNECAHFSIFI